ncbi:F-type H+-transporting ATPase subunit epsilon [Balnearium lithotrophicum]|uniref:ATP synthase epsilon chain n=1 Tax=Balnearium lithotrophicum TaxID=223788 RepID=A0A521C3N9_9BACT|nr:ATP synthase F1 subunit epsilon [Balnearium lithotrophicum]SMO54018.1 F-type H+-transporting ATPase subunit epsilon [Balnearium lithotrophicum]
MAAKKGLPTVMDFKLASSTGKHYEAKAKEVYVETDDGDLGVLPGHQPEFYSIGAGFVVCKTESGEEIKKLVYNGFVQIEPDAVRIGAQEIYETGEVDIEAVEKEIGELKERLISLSEEETEQRSQIEREIRRKETLLRKAR